jgi:hypothetical protein
VQVFSICPARELMIKTAEFWKTKEAGMAFHQMCESTAKELERFDLRGEPDWIRAALVGRLGQVSYLDDF